MNLMIKEFVRNASLSKIPCDICTPLPLSSAIRNKKIDLSKCVIMNILPYIEKVDMHERQTLNGLYIENIENVQRYTY